MKNIQIKNSYNIWKLSQMRSMIEKECWERYDSIAPCFLLNRLYTDMYIEWWLHNIGYYVTKPFCKIEFFKKINLRCKDVDLNEW